MSAETGITHSWRAWLTRVACCLVFWWIVAGFDVRDLPVGLAAAVAAAWSSLRLLPPGDWKLRPVPLAVLTARFLRQSVVAGVDITRRALDPRLPLRPGLVVYHSQLPLGARLNAFCTITSLLPGTLPSGYDAKGDLLVHCLDVGQPVAEQLAAEETRQAQAFGEPG